VYQTATRERIEATEYVSTVMTNVSRASGRHDMIRIWVGWFKA